ncbi:hypothetical protein BV25DRAFT_1916465 [Artomyces pyxidatus]|uniref:Uncharacterized protein n=1 Tax=Artomyces pyxidatus TaxID=48021 RepID=A0ACB8SZA3_9AGAM|nr:hypothetical protein BV25DRAFT_1916465 [Artomyces pyxidatus]
MRTAFAATLLAAGTASARMHRACAPPRPETLTAQPSRAPQVEYPTPTVISTPAYLDFTPPARTPLRPSSEAARVVKTDASAPLASYPAPSIVSPPARLSPTRARPRPSMTPPLQGHDGPLLPSTAAAQAPPEHRAGAQVVFAREAP